MKRIVRSISLWILGLSMGTFIGCTPGNGLLIGGPRSEDQFTILLKTLTGTDHVQLADFYLKRTRQYTGWQGLYVVNKDESSVLYWGGYLTAQDAMKNLRTAKEYTTPATKEHVFRMATIVPLPGKDIGPDEWNLKNAQGEYTVLVAVFQDLPERDYFGRKKRAVELCEKLRAQGREAYFMHDIARSGVTIGTFPATAIKTHKKQRKHPHTGDLYYEDQRVVVAPKMKSVLKDYPELLYCGNTEILTVIDPQTKKLVKKTSPSVPLSISEFKKGRMKYDAFHHSGNP